jgi:lipopolysaccharide transport protein LptA
MPRKTTTRALQRVRTVLLFGLLLFVGALVALYLFGRQPPSGPAVATSDDTPSGPDVKIIGRRFRYEVTEEGEKLFTIEADRLLSDEASLYILEGVKVTMDREDGARQTMTADRGTYRLEINEASLQGHVVLTGTGGLRLETEGLELSRHGKLVVSTAPVRIAMGDVYRGEANRLEVLFSKDRLLLAGKVVLETAPGVEPRAALRARRAMFFRDTHNFLAEGYVELEREADRLTARRLSLNFDEQDRNILFANASWNVEATLQRIDGDEVTSIAKVTGDQLSVVFDEITADPERLEIGSPDGEAAYLRLAEASGVVRTMEADHLWAQFEEGHVRQAQGIGGVKVEESQRGAADRAIRRISSDQIEANYDREGTLTELELEGDVVYREADLRAEGDRLTAKEAEGTVDLIGDLAWLQNDDGHLAAPVIRYERQTGRATATGGVRAELAAKSGPDLAVGEEAEEPTRIEAGRAEWSREPERFSFNEDVRAWQGENFLVCQSMTMEDRELIADGGVRSVWHERTKPPLPGSEGTAAANGDEAQPVSISSRRMRYLEKQGRLIYEGNAEITQGGRRMSCPLLQLEVNEDRQFERMYCEGGTQIADSVGGSQIAGSAAIYNTEASKIKVIGEPARMTRASGGTISARLMVYDFETAIAEIDSVKDEDASLFMTASEYFQQFGGAPLPPGDPMEGAPGAGEGAPTLPEADPPATDEGSPR